jgi:hypothetical protein
MLKPDSSSPAKGRRWLPALALLLGACTAPRSVLNSPEALAKGRWQAGVNVDVNLPTETSDRIYGGLEKGVDGLYERTANGAAAPITADSLNGYALALLAYSLDPLNAQTGVYIRYGFLSRLDGGYHYAGGPHAIEMRWQFLGPKADDSVAPGQSRWQGSVGAQYSWQSFQLPAVLGLDKLQDMLSFELTRKNILIPVIFGKPFGPSGRYGSFGLGAAYNLSFVHYGSDVLKLVERKEDGTTADFAPLRGDKIIPSYGYFGSLRAGYRWVYLLASAAAYWQDYGRFDLFGDKSYRLRGWTYLSSCALEIRF